jgi:ABC-2 type transport system permease protein
MNKTGLIIKREYLTRVKKKSFIVMTFLGPLLFAGLMVGAIFLAMSDDTTHNVLVTDEFGIVVGEGPDGKPVKATPRFFEDSERIHYFFTNDPISDQEFIDSEYTLLLQTNELTFNNGKAELVHKKLPSMSVKSQIKNELEGALEEVRILRKQKNNEINLTYEQYKSINQKVTLVDQDIESDKKDSLKQERAAVGFVFAVIIYFFIFLYGVQVMRGVIEEKTNRIVEVIVSSVKPFQLMMGKIVGIGLVGLTQFLLWVVLSGVIFLIVQIVFNAGYVSPSAVLDQQQMAQVGGDQQDLYAVLAQNPVFEVLFRINWPLMIGSFIFYFIGGFLLYGSLFAAVGAAVDSETDTQQFMLPVSIPLVFGFIVAEFMLTNPEGSIGQIFAIIPFTSPIVMMLQVAMGPTGGIWLVLTSALVLIATFILIVWIAGKIYRTGILMYGKKASYKELWRWLRFKS